MIKIGLNVIDHQISVVDHQIFFFHKINTKKKFGDLLCYFGVNHSFFC